MSVDQGVINSFAETGIVVAARFMYNEICVSGMNLWAISVILCFHFEVVWNIDYVAVTQQCACVVRVATHRAVLLYLEHHKCFGGPKLNYCVFVRYSMTW